MIRAYFNLHKKLFSIQEKVNGRWKVTRHVNFLALKDVKFKVSEAGRQRVLREGRKNVHAYVYGEELIKYEIDSHGYMDLYYDPYKYDSFVDRYGNEVNSVDYLILEVKDKRAKLIGVESRWLND